MPEDPKPADKIAQGNEEATPLRDRVGRFLYDNPTFALTLIYIDLSGIGLLYAFLFYRQLGVQILDFTEVGDFLLIAFRFPIVILVALLSQAIALVFLALTSVVQRWNMGIRLYLPVILVFLTGLMIVGLAFWHAEAIKQGGQSNMTIHPKMTVQYRQFENSTGQVTIKGLTFVGATQRVAFFYNLGDEETLVIPQSQIVSMRVLQQDVKLPGQEE